MRVLTVLAVAVLIALYQIGAQAAPVETAYQPTTEREQWAIDLLTALGNAQPTADTVALVVAWQDEEGTSAAYNPLATSQDMPGATVFNSSGVKNYPDYQTGIEATVITLQYSYAGYADILAGLQTNDPDRALAGLTASPWAAEAGYGDRIRSLWSRPTPAAPAEASAVSSPIAVGGDDCGYNVLAALNAASGALQNVQLAPGETFSFNEWMGDPAYIDYRVCAGVPGGNWCNLAARYAQVARAIGLVPQFQDHGVGDLGAGPENSVAIWNIGGIAGFEGGRQDLLIQNTTNRIITFQAIQQDGAVVITGGLS